jgi:DNA-binding LacI/PurR family transcriptional regulator
MLDIASEVGLSRSAVSLALQNHPSLPESTRVRVREAAARLGYRKNPLVAALMSTRRTGRTGQIRAELAFVTAHPAGDSWRNVAPHLHTYQAAMARACELGFRLEEFSLSQPGVTARRIARSLAARGIQGVLAAPLPGNEFRLALEVDSLAVVGLGLSVHQPPIDRIASDHYQGARLAFSRCLELGYRRIGLALAADISRRLEDRWWSGVLAAQQALPAGLLVPALMPQSQTDIPILLREWIDRHRVEAVIFAIRRPEMMAAAPAHVGLVSLSAQEDGGEVAGIVQDEARIGAEAIEWLVSKMNRWQPGPATDPRLLLVPGRWTDGPSAPGSGCERRSLRA